MPNPNSRRGYSGGAPETTLSTSINSSDDTITIANSTGWPLGQDGLLITPVFCVINRGKPNEEKIAYGPRTGNTLNNCERGVDGSNASSHAAGETIEHIFAAQDADEANKHYATTDPNFVPHTQLVHKTVANSISANNTYTGTNTYANDVFLQGDVDVTGNMSANNFTAEEVYGTVEYSGSMVVTGNATFQGNTTINNPIIPGINSGTPSTINGTTTAFAGVSAIPAARDHRHAIDAAALANLIIPVGLRGELPYGSSTPTGWLSADGQAVSRTTYPALFAAIGTTYGAGNGTTTFNIPDYNDGSFARGTDTSVGSSGGSDTVTIAKTNLPSLSHTHGIDEDFTFRVVAKAPGLQNDSLAGPSVTGVTYTDIDAADPGGSSTPLNVQPKFKNVKIIIKAH